MSDLFESIFICPTKRLQPQNLGKNPDGIDYHYKLNYDGLEYFVNWAPGETLEDGRGFIQENLHILRGLLYNGTFPQPMNGFNVSVANLKEVVKDSVYPITSTQKRNGFIEFLYRNQEWEGNPMSLVENTSLFDEVMYRNFFKNSAELLFYIDTLKELGYVKATSNNTGRSGYAFNTFRLTFKGLEFIENMHNSGPQSKKCFIAMSFNEKSSLVQAIEETIKKVVRKCNYEPVIVKDQHVKSDRTINDQIIADIRGCKFLIADFTEQKAGVYFEAGFAAGLGRPVIYTVHKPDLKNSHFDTKPMQHIVYENVVELEEKLTNKIKAWIV